MHYCGFRWLLLLKPLPFRDPSRLIAAWDTYLPQFPKMGVSPAELELWRQQSDIFEQTGWYRYVSLDLDLTAPGADALEVHTTFVSPSLLPMHSGPTADLTRVPLHAILAAMAG